MKLGILIICAILAMPTATSDHIGPSRGYDGWGYYENSDISSPMLPAMVYQGNRDYDENGRFADTQKPVSEALTGVQYFLLLSQRPNNVYFYQGQNAKQINGYTVFQDWKNKKVIIYKGNNLAKTIRYLNFIGSKNIFDHYAIISKFKRTVPGHDNQYYDVLHVVDLEGDQTWDFKMVDVDIKQYNNPEIIENLPYPYKNGIAIVSNMAIDLRIMKLLWTLNPKEQFLGFDGNNVISMNYYEKYEEGKTLEEMKHYEIVKRDMFEGKELGRYELTDKTLYSTATVVNGTLIGQEQYERKDDYIKIRHVMFLAKLGEQKPYCTLESDRWAMRLRLSGDRNHLFVNNQNRQMCIELKTGKQEMSIPRPSIISFQSFAGQMYMNWESTDANGRNYEHLSLFGLLSPIISKPKDYFRRSNDYPSMTTLIPTKQGILWVPNNQSFGKPQLLSRTGKKIKEFSLPGWGGECMPSSAVVGYRLLVDCTGKSLNIVSLADDRVQTIEYTEKVGRRLLTLPRPMLANDHFCVVLDTTCVIHVIDLDRKKVVSSSTDQNNCFNTNIEIRDNLYFGNFLYNFDMNGKLPQTDYKLPMYLGMLKGSFYTKKDNAYDPSTNVTSKSLFETSFIGNTKKTYTVPEDIDQYFYDNLTNFQIVTDNSVVKCCNFVIDMEKRVLLYPTIASFNQRNMEVSMITADGFVETMDNSILQYRPCPTYSLRRTDNFSFELDVTSSGQDIPLLEGKARLVVMGDNANTPKVFLDPGSDLKIKKSGSGDEVTLEFKPTEKFLDALKNGSNRYGLIIESNGLLDTSKSELSDGVTEKRTLYDGIPVISDTPKSMVLTIWRM